MIKRLGFASFPVDRLQLEFTGDDVRVIEWLRGRTYKLPELFRADQDENSTLGLLHSSSRLTEDNIKGFLQRLWDCTGHMRCCADLQRTQDGA